MLEFLKIMQKELETNFDFVGRLIVTSYKNYIVSGFIDNKMEYFWKIKAKEFLILTNIRVREKKFKK